MDPVAIALAGAITPPVPITPSTFAPALAPIFGFIVNHNGVLYYGGGDVYNSATNPTLQPLNSVTSYDPATGTVTARAQIPTQHEQAITVSDGTYIWVLGGRPWGGSTTGTTQVDRYSPAANTWSASFTSIPNYHYTGTGAVISGRIVCIGGFNPYANGGGVFNDQYNITANTWSTGAAWPKTDAYNQYVSSCLIGSTLYILCGDGTFWTYNYTANLWAQIASAPTLPSNGYVNGWHPFDLNVIDGVILVSIPGGTGTTVSPCYQYDPATNAWSWLPQFITSRTNTYGAQVGTKFYKVGGQGPTGYLTTGEVVDLAQVLTFRRTLNALKGYLGT